MITLAEGWGERVGEPDVWSGEHIGFPIFARRNGMGVWCGYIGLPAGHPWSGLANPRASVHGGVTYAHRDLPSASATDASAWVSTAATSGTLCRGS
jgi:hypothetical protein